jgi:uncharacterized protein (TIGR02145 family)
MIITDIKCGDVDCPSIKIKNPHNKINEQFIDTRDKQIYQVVNIEGKLWMAENLNYSGDIGNNYGKLYDWETAKTACQVGGWRLPNDQDLSSLAKTNEVLSRSRAVDLTPCNESPCNNTGFTALAQGNYASWWSSVEQAQQVRILEINTSLPTQQSAGSIYFSLKTSSHSIRCVR